MRCVFVLLTVTMLVTSLGCSGVSTIERANLTPPMAREEYVRAHPGNSHGECIRNGEITRGMTADEVIASWGLPNVLVISSPQPNERWIYYLKDRNSLSMLIYTLSFADDTLKIWSIDQKRFTGQAVVSTFESQREASPSSGPGDKRRR